MTAINAYGRGAKGLLLTDTAYYDAAGVVGAFGRKAIALPRQGMAIAVRGDSRLPAALAQEIDASFDIFDDFLAEAQVWLTDWYLEVEPALDIPGGERHLDVVVVGWSESHRAAEAYALSSMDHRPAGGIAPFDLARHDYVIAPSIPTGGPLVGDPEQILLRLIDRQRAMTWPCGSSTDAAPAHIVGGEAVMMEITASGVIERVVRRWPDRIGEKITPAAETAGLNRQQRRAARAKAAA